MHKVIVIVLAGALLSGCATTLTLGALGIAAALGVGQGAGQFVGRQIASGAYRKHIAWKRCHRIRDRYLLHQCVQRYAPEYF